MSSWREGRGTLWTTFWQYGPCSKGRCAPGVVDGRRARRPGRRSLRSGPSRGSDRLGFSPCPGGAGDAEPGAALAPGRALLGARRLRCQQRGDGREDPGGAGQGDLLVVLPLPRG
ncbi:MAG: hypothetical protein MZU97_07930 [Bacillus subtilis]|nr:hypothetical protein [Bacillus subtilis]